MIDAMTYSISQSLIPQLKKTLKATYLEELENSHKLAKLISKRKPKL